MSGRFLTLVVHPRSWSPIGLKSAVSRACRYEPELKPDLCGNGSPLRDLCLTGPPSPHPQGQSESRERRADRQTLDLGRPASSHVLHSGRAQYRHPTELLGRLNERASCASSNNPVHQLFLRSSIDPTRCHCPRSSTNTPSGKSPPSTSTTTSKSTNITTACRFGCLREKLDVRLTAHTVEAFQKGERVTAHVRSFLPHRHSTRKEHMPLAHQNYLEWTPSRIIDWAKKTGPATAELIQTIIQSRTYPEQAYRCLLRHPCGWKNTTLKSAWKKPQGRALKFGARSFQSLRKILSCRTRPLGGGKTQGGSDSALADHANIRGSHYYH